jgi:hypothetical protein
MIKRILLAVFLFFIASVAAAQTYAGSKCDPLFVSGDDGGVINLSFTCQSTPPNGSLYAAIYRGATSYVLLNDLHVTTINSWIGTNFTAFESGGTLKITLPDGRVRYWSNAFDKHVDNLADQYHDGQVNWILPAGTILDISLVIAPHGTGCAYLSWPSGTVSTNGCQVTVGFSFQADLN